MTKPSVALVLAALVGPALAHPGPEAANGFLHELEHPIFRTAHLLAMLAVGLWSGFFRPTVLGWGRRHSQW